MLDGRTHRITGHVRIEDRKNGRVWIAKYRLADGSETRKVLGSAWVKDTGRRTPRGGVVWRAADGPCPEGHLTPRQAQEALAALLAGEKAKPMNAPRVGGKTLGEASAAWLHRVETVGGRRGSEITPTTLRGYRSSVKRMHTVLAEERALRRILPAHVSGYQERLLAEGLSRGTVRQHMITLRSVLEHACEVGWLGRVPFDGVRVVSQPPASADFNVLEPSQVEAVARAAAEVRDADVVHYRGTATVDVRALEWMTTARVQYAEVIRLAAYTGLRIGELRALRWRDVDLLGETLHVRRNAPSSAPAGTAARAPKSSKARSVPIIDQAAQVLGRVKDRAEAAGMTTEGDDLVFRARTGGMIEDGRARDAFYRGLERAGYGRLRAKDNPMTLHDLRHTFATIAVRVFDLVDVQAYLGHSNIETTMRYAHHVPRHDAARRLSEAFAADRGAPSLSPREDTAPRVSR